MLTWTHLTLVSLMTSFPTITTKFQLQFYLLHYLGCDKHVSVLKTNYNYVSQHVKVDLNKKLDPKEKTIQAFNIDVKGFRKTRIENPPTWEKGVAS